MRLIFLYIAMSIIAAGCAKKIIQPSPAPSTANDKAIPETKNEKITEETVRITDGDAQRIEAGKEIYNAKCGRCHELKNEQDYTVEEWKPIMDRMAPKAGLDSAGKANITVYVNNHAKKSGT